MFTLRFTNVECSSDGRKFATLREAIAAGRAAGFEFSVWFDRELIMSWSVFGGSHFHTAATLDFAA